MKRLTKHQYDLLKKLANSKIKTFCAVSVVGNEQPEFNETLQLVEMKLLIDVSEKFADVVEKSTKNGDDAVVTALTFRGQWMFERTKWENRIN